MDMVMILREDRKRSSIQHRDNYEPENYFEDDEFIDKNWNNKHAGEENFEYNQLERQYEREYSEALAEAEDII